MKITHGGTVYTLPVPPKPTLGEMRDFTRALRMSVSDVEEAAATDPLVGVIVMCYLAMHRADPSITVDDVQAIPMEDLAFEPEPGEEAGPTAPGNRATRRSTARPGARKGAKAKASVTSRSTSSPA